MHRREQRRKEVEKSKILRDLCDLLFGSPLAPLDLPLVYAKFRTQCRPKIQPRSGAQEPQAIKDFAICYQPPLRVSSRKRSSRSFVIGPGLPSPIVRPSRLMTATTSAALPVRKHSSAE